jgi:hypothetical protein
VATLNPTTAFVHACAHAAKDNWLYQRNLVDVERLARPLSVAQRQQLRRHKLVRWSSLVSHAATAAPHLLPLCETLPPGVKTRLERQAEHFQRLRGRSLGPDGWTVGSRLRGALHILALSKRPADWFPQLVPPTGAQPRHTRRPDRCSERHLSLDPRPGALALCKVEPATERHKPAPKSVTWEMSALN